MKATPMRFLTLLALALVMAGIVVVAANAQNVDGQINYALEVVVKILRAILDVIVDFIGAVLDEFVRAGKNFFGGGQKA